MNANSGSATTGKRIGPYEVEQLKDALVVDSAGFIYGKVKDVEILEDKIFLRLYKEVEKKTTEVDIRALKVRLMEKLGRGFLSLFRPMTYERLCDKVRKTLKLGRDTQIKDEHLITFAEIVGVELPFCEVVKTYKQDVPEPLDFNLVSAAGTTKLGTCILLSKPLEAMRRGLKIHKKPPYITTEKAKGMLVITSDAKIVGLAHEILIGRPMMLRISIGYYEEREVQSVQLLIEQLVPDVYPSEKKLFEEIAKQLQIEPTEITESKIKEWAENKGYEIPVKVEREWVEERRVDIAWEKISAIGDVILLKIPEEEFT